MTKDSEVVYVNVFNIARTNLGGGPVISEVSLIPSHKQRKQRKNLAYSFEVFRHTNRHPTFFILQNLHPTALDPVLHILLLHHHHLVPPVVAPMLFLVKHEVAFGMARGMANAIGSAEFFFGAALGTESFLFGFEGADFVTDGTLVTRVGAGTSRDN